MKLLYQISLNTLKISSIVLISIFIINCSPPENPTFEVTEKGIPDEQSDSIRITTMNMNKLEYVLEAVHTNRFYDDKMLYADTITIKTFNPDGTIKSTLYSDKAEINEMKDEFIAKQNVKLTNENGVLHCNYLVWDRKTNQVYAKGKVILERNGNILRGYELKTDREFKEIEMINISGEGEVDEKSLDF